jgi:hypothetical protein
MAKDGKVKEESEAGGIGRAEATFFRSLSSLVVTV